jgi:hypothetical protein
MLEELDLKIGSATNDKNPMLLTVTVCSPYGPCQLTHRNCE